MAEKCHTHTNKTYTKTSARTYIHTHTHTPAERHLVCHKIGPPKGSLVFFSNCRKEAVTPPPLYTTL